MQNPFDKNGKIWDFLWEGMWTEGIRLFLGYWRGWIVGAAIFTLLFILIAFADGQEVTSNIVLGIAHDMLDFAQIYFFAVCFLNQEPVTGSIKLGPRQAIVAIASIAIVKTLLNIVIGGIPALLNYAAGASALAQAGGLIGKLLFLFVGARLLCIAPLAVNQIEKPFHLGLRLTTGKTLRLMTHLAMLGLIVSPLFLVVSADGTAPLDQVIFVFITGIFTAFACSATRILYGENIAANLEHDRRLAPRG